ncbi:MAG: carbohydrate ABC transporter permease [Treponema sp.]|jgi:putative aldouronate transport system permease protein|nr:carbohydrate ABC transporter permease [Treponema sp.]
MADKMTAGDRIFLTLVTTFLIFFTILILYPLFFILSASFSDPQAVLRGRMWLWPVGWNLNAYRRVFSNAEIGRSFFNSVFYTVTGTFFSLALTTLAAFCLSRRDLPGKTFLTLFFTFTMFFAGGIIPTYLVIRGLGMFNTFWVMVIPGSVSVFNLLVMRTFMSTSIPEELFEAAYVDGCSNTRILFAVVLPLSASIIVVMILFYGVNYWNEFFKALIYLKDRFRYPLQLILREILLESQADSMTELESTSSKVLLSEGIKYASCIVASAPLLLIYPFLQKFFERGIMVGAVKG